MCSPSRAKIAASELLLVPIGISDQNMFSPCSKSEFMEQMACLEQYMYELSTRLDTFTCMHPKVDKFSKRDIEDLWEILCNSPLTFDHDCYYKILRLYFNLSNYHPAEVQVLVQNLILTVEAVHEDENDPCNTTQFNVSYPLPRIVDPKTIQATMSRDGVLTVQALLPIDLKCCLNPPKLQKQRQ